VDIDLLQSAKVSWSRDKSPWNVAEGVLSHKCAVKDVSLCRYFCGVDYPDKKRCAYGQV